MSTRLLLFKAIKSLIADDKFNIQYAYLEENSTMSCGIYIRSGKSPDIREFSGEYLNRHASLVFNINTKDSLEGIEEGDIFCERIFKTLQECFNYTYEEDGQRITILKTDILGDINYIGRNTFGIRMYSLNFDITYA